MATDLEGFERAYRLRSSTDDGLLQQIFGQEELESLTKVSPSLLETARGYFPHLTSSTYDRLVREPDALRVEKDRCEREMEQLAVQNYGAFIGNARVTRSVRQELSDIQRHLDEMMEKIAPVQDDITKFTATSTDLGVKRSSLRNVLQQHSSLLELLELPQLLDACVRNQLFDESLELLSYCGNMLQAHEARGEDIPVLNNLREQVSVQRSNLHASLVSQLKTDIHLPACVRVIGFLRRIHQHSEEELRRLFIEHRGSFLETHKQQVEQLRGHRGSVVTALRNAADLIRTHVYDIGTQYRALFPQEDGPLCAWLSEQIVWLTGLLRAHILPPEIGHCGQGQSPNRSAMAGNSGSGSPSSRAPGAVPGVRIDAAALAMILRQVLHASSTLKRLGGQFFPAVARIFEARMDHHVREMLDFAVLTFHAELGRYDWVPSTALAGGSGSANMPPGQGNTSVGWLHPQALELTRHRPLAVFTNDLVQMFNELRQCSLYGLRIPVVSSCYECLMSAVNLLKSVRASQLMQLGSAKANELMRLSQNFAHILTPLVAAHLEAIFGSNAKLDVAAITAAMMPDLLPPSNDDANYSFLKEETPQDKPAENSPPQTEAAAESATGPQSGQEAILESAGEGNPVQEAIPELAGEATPAPEATVEGSAEAATETLE